VEVISPLSRKLRYFFHLSSSLAKLPTSTTKQIEPIITSDTGGVATYVRQGLNGIRVPLTAGAGNYAEWIWRLFYDRTAYTSMALAGWEEYRQRLNWETSISSLLTLLRQGGRS